MLSPAIFLGLLSLLPVQESAPVDLESWRDLVALACVDCHGGLRTEAGLDLARALEEPTAFRGDWERAYGQVLARSMPPREALDDEEREEWIAGALAALDGEVLGSSATARRLTRSQLGLVFEDLLGVDVPLQDYLPRDASAYGFDTTGDVLFVTPLSFETLYEVVDLAVGMGREAAKAAVFEASPSSEERLLAFLERAFRRPPTEGERSERLALMQAERERGESEESALDSALQATLLSPAFLYRNELSAEPDDHQRAAQLGLLLWGRLPDEELSALAGAGRLRDPGIIEAQVRRMLDDGRARWLAEDFALQWLGVSELADVTPDIRRFRAFKEPLRAAMRAEVVAFFEDLIAEDRSLLECLDSEAVFVDERLAKHYGIEGVEGRKLRRVERGERTERGGVLGMAAIHTITSEPLRTSPVKRGQWLLERLLRSPAPPPPPNAGVLPEDDQQEDGLSLRERLEQHRRDPVCASCHARMDPYGFSLEAFDGIGRLRVDVDSSATLPGGVEVDGPVELKAELLREAPRFARAFVDHLFIYAVGRTPGLADHRALEQVVDRARANGYRIRDLIVGVATTPAFLGEQL